MSDLSIFEIQADLCKAMGNATRLEIVHLLRSGAMKVSDIVQACGYEQTTVSRHLGILKNAGILTVYGKGRDVFYQIANPKIIEMCDVVRLVLLEQTFQQSQVLRAMDESNPTST